MKQLKKLRLDHFDNKSSESVMPRINWLDLANPDNSPYLSLVNETKNHLFFS